MKNNLTVVLALTTVILGAFCVAQWQKLASQKTQLDALRTDLAQKTQQIENLQTWKKNVDSQRVSSLVSAGDPTARLLARQLAAAQAAASAPTNTLAGAEADKSDKGGMGKLVAKLMENPETRKFIREQQRTMLDTMYGPLFKQMGLAPEDTDKLKELMLDNMMKATEKTTALMGGGSATNRTEAIQALNAEQKVFDAQLKDVLGETRYALYKDYQETVGERMQLNQFTQQAGSGVNPLSDQQIGQLLQVMKEEKQNVAATTGQPVPGSGQDQANLEAMFSGNGVDKILQSQEAVQQRVFERAKGLLAADQLEAFGKFQTKQLETMRSAMGMARIMFAPDKPEGAPAQPNP